MVANPEGDDDCFSENMDYKQQYKTLKRKLKFLIYENECFQEALKTTQRKLLKASRDKTFLLDRLLAYEKVEVSSDDDDDTDSSDNGEPPRDIKRKKMDHGAHVYGGMSSSSNSSKALPAKKKRLPQRPPKQNTVPQLSSLLSSEGGIGDGHMTPEEVERHLESQQGHMELIPSKVPSTVPPDLFSNEPSFDDSELNEVYCELETSPSNIADECLTVDMMPD